MRIIYAILIFFITCNAYSDNDTQLKRQTTQNFIESIGNNIDKLHDQFIKVTKGQFDLYLRNNPKITEKDIEPYKEKIHITKDEYLDFWVTILYENFTTEEIQIITKFHNSKVGVKWLSKKNELTLKNMRMSATMYRKVRDKMHQELSKINE